MIRYLLLAVLLLAIAAPVAAQDDAAIDCPAGLVCVAYGEDVFELDPSCGPVIGQAIEETTTTRRTLDTPEGVTTITGRALVFTLLDGGGYEVSAIVPTRGVELDTTGCMQWDWEDGAADE